MSLVTAVPRTPLLICVDVEPDGRAIDPGVRADWNGFEQTCAFVRDLRAALAEATVAPVHLCWFLRMDPQIAHVYGSADWAMTRYRDLIRELEAAGDEIGLHPHFWRWDQEQARWIVDVGNARWVERCLRQSFAAFEHCFGRGCRSIRLGDAWMNDAAMTLIERLGARFDLTVEPGRAPDTLPEPFTGSFPNYAGAPRRPYRPSRRDFRTPGRWWTRTLWEIPLTT
ncbi:MAG: hypothetical protein ACREKH_07660, partial [Candidatus Rokuibacteriota bacterium]